ncbi:MAG: prephenate dehydratase, partial [Pseudomonadota bacterium]
MNDNSRPESTIAFQGRPGAHSHLACKNAFPELDALPCEAFEDAFEAIHSGFARLAMIPIDNSVAGRVADVHHLLPGCGLRIVGEHFERISQNLLGVPKATLETVQYVESHIHALGQCRKFIAKHGFSARVVADTAGAAADIAQRGDTTVGAIASRFAAETYGLAIVAHDIEDAEHNTTRFLVLARDGNQPGPRDGTVVTTFVFKVRNVPAALYKALGGFATNGVNMLKLESYIDSAFNQAQFYADIIGHPEHLGVRYAFDELRFFAHSIEILGV